MDESLNRSRWRLGEAVLCGLVLLAAFSIRVGLYPPKVTPDGELYQRIADNVLANGCYSESPPAEALCSPTWANQPPGYALFIVFVKAVSSGTPKAIVIAQALIYCLSIGYLLIGCRQAVLRGRGWLVVVAILLGFSPLTGAWSRWILTETLGAAASMWVLTECIRSVTTKTFRTVPLSLSVAATVLMRWDLITILTPVILLVWRMRGQPRIWIRLGTVLAAVAFPILVLMARAVVVGLPAVPLAHAVGPDEIPQGVVRFWKVASTSQDATSGLLYKVWRKQYSTIEAEFDYGSISSQVDTSKLRPALRALSSVRDGESVPRELDESIAAIANDALTRGGVSYWPRVWLERAVAMWTAKDMLTRSGWPVTHETYLRPYRITLLALVVVALFFLPRGSTERFVGIGVGLLVAARTLFLVTLNALEIRYLLPVIPLMEFVAILVIGNLLTSLGVVPAAATHPGPEGARRDSRTYAESRH